LSSKTFGNIKFDFAKYYFPPSLEYSDSSLTELRTKIKNEN